MGFVRIIFQATTRLLEKQALSSDDYVEMQTYFYVLGQIGAVLAYINALRQGWQEIEEIYFDVTK